MNITRENLTTLEDALLRASVAVETLLTIIADDTPVTNNGRTVTAGLIDVTAEVAELLCACEDLTEVVGRG